MAPHIIWPMRFLLPHHQALRPRWSQTAFLIYDHLYVRKLLPKARRVDLRRDPAGQLLQPKFKTAFEYSGLLGGRLSTGRVESALDAYRRGAKIMPHEIGYRDLY